jgi:histidinol-phosphate aminotransferase
MSVKASVRALLEYNVPQEAPIKLNQNESPFDPPAELKAEILAALKAQAWNRYPSGDQEPLRRKIAEYTDFPSEGILTGCGSNELIQTLIQALCAAGDRVAVVNPGFSVYSRVATVLELDVNEIPLKKDFSFDVNRIAAAAADDKLVFLASPNNPTGTSLSPAEVEWLASRLKGTLVIDEAYYEFSQQSAQSLVSRSDRLLILRTFSKAWGLAGLRLGYLLGRPEIIPELRKAKLPFSLGLFPQLAGDILLNKVQWVQEAAQTIVAERERVFQALTSLPGIAPIPSDANFILFRTENLTAQQLFQRFREEGILLRCFDSPRLVDCLRVTVGRPEENEVFIKTLTSILRESGR